MPQPDLTKETFGGKISLKYANAMIEEAINLNTMIVRTVQSPPGDTDLRDRATVMNNETYNAFIFTKDLIMRFFDGSEKDDSGNPRSANFLMVLLGAHPHDCGEFKAGSPTVMTVGCERKIINPGGVDGDEEVRFYPLGIAQPANEYPPKMVVTRLEGGEEKFQPMSYFLMT